MAIKFESTTTDNKKIVFWVEKSPGRTVRDLAPIKVCFQIESSPVVKMNAQDFLDIANALS